MSEASELFSASVSSSPNASSIFSFTEPEPLRSKWMNAVYSP